MTDTDNGQGSASERRTEVIRDATFFRGVADRGWVFDLERDMEISFLQASPLMEARIMRGNDDDVEEGFEYSGSVTEIARVRMPPYAVLMMSVNALERLIKSGRVDGRGLISQISTMVDDNQDNNQEIQGEPQ